MIAHSMSRAGFPRCAGGRYPMCGPSGVPWWAILAVCTRAGQP